MTVGPRTASAPMTLPRRGCCQANARMAKAMFMDDLCPANGLCPKNSLCPMNSFCFEDCLGPNDLAKMRLLPSQCQDAKIYVYR